MSRDIDSPGRRKRRGLWPRPAEAHKEKKDPGQRGEGAGRGPAKRPDLLREAQSNEALCIAAAHEQQRGFAAFARAVQRRYSVGRVRDGLLIDARNDVAGAKPLLRRRAIRCNGGYDGTVDVARNSERRAVT